MNIQPELTDLFDVPFYGEAKTITGDIWWYEQDGLRIPLKPIQPVPQSEGDK